MKTSGDLETGLKTSSKHKKRAFNGPFSFTAIETELHLRQHLFLVERLEAKLVLLLFVGQHLQKHL